MPAALSVLMYCFNALLVELWSQLVAPCAFREAARPRAVSRKLENGRKYAPFISFRPAIGEQSCCSFSRLRMPLVGISYDVFASARNNHIQP